MGQLKERLKRAEKLLDWVLLPAVLLAAPANIALARMNQRLPRCRRMMEQMGVLPVRHHYYSPLLFPEDIRAPLHHERSITGLDLNEAGQLAFVAALNYRDELLGLPLEKTVDTDFAYHNGSFEPGDAELLYGIIRRAKPRRIVEVGCGHSTLMARTAILRNKEEDPAYICEQICIEPFENPWLERLGVTVVRKKVEDVDSALIKLLAANDIFFIDSSHVIRPQGDVLHEYLHLLGLVAPGVLVHVHDIFTPRDYPADWLLDKRLMWNEQYLLEAFLAFNRDFRVLAALNWLWHNHRDKLRDACPVLQMEPQREPGSFWFVRN